LQQISQSVPPPEKPSPHTARKKIKTQKLTKKLKKGTENTHQTKYKKKEEDRRTRKKKQTEEQERKTRSQERSTRKKHRTTYNTKQNLTTKNNTYRLQK
jgi:hypothetical protein